MRVDVVLRRRERLPWPAVGAQFLKPVEPLQGRVRGLRLEVAADQREEPDEVVAVPVAVDVGLAEADPGTGSELAPEGLRTAELDDHGRAGSVPEAASTAVGIAQHDLAPLERCEGTEREPPCDVGREPHRFTEPRPGTNGGLR